MATKAEDKFQVDMQRLFGSELGQAVLAELELRFARRIMRDTPHATAYAVGQADLIMWMKELSEPS